MGVVSTAAERREELKLVFRQASVCERCPQLAADAHPRRVRRPATPTRT